MITYKKFFDHSEITFPVLHRVKIRDFAYYYTINSWCKDNCRAPYYMAPSWAVDCAVEFEDDEDATLFALRWS